MEQQAQEAAKQETEGRNWLKEAYEIASDKLDIPVEKDHLYALANQLFQFSQKIELMQDVMAKAIAKGRVLEKQMVGRQGPGGIILPQKNPILKPT